jgi:hypothetical protein
MQSFDATQVIVEIAGIRCHGFRPGDRIVIRPRPRPDYSRSGWRWGEFRRRFLHYRARMRWKARIRKFWICAELLGYPPPRDDLVDALTYSIVQSTWKGKHR